MCSRKVITGFYRLKSFEGIRRAMGRKFKICATEKQKARLPCMRSPCHCPNWHILYVLHSFSQCLHMLERYTHTPSPCFFVFVCISLCYELTSPSPFWRLPQHAHRRGIIILCGSTDIRSLLCRYITYHIFLLAKRRKKFQ